MVAPRTIRKVICTVIQVPATDEDIMHLHSRIDTRPSNLLPWADPAIARLVTRLQDEVRHQRRQEKLTLRSLRTARADLEPPVPSTEPDWDWSEETRWKDDWRSTQ